MKTWLAFSLCAFGACVPTKTVPVEEIPKIAKLDDLMAVQATYADAQFKKIGQASFTDAEYAQLADTGAHIKATSRHITDFSKGPEFDKLAGDLGLHAEALTAAANIKDVSAVNSALREMKETCKTCHKKFK